MTAEEWSIVGTCIAIIMFITAGLAFSYNGFKQWRKSINSGYSEDGWARFEFILGIILFILAIISVLVLIRLVKNHKIVNSPEVIPTVSIMPTESVEPESKEVYVKNLTFHGASYSGYVNESRQPNGLGTMKYSDGSEYTGNWVNGVQQGHGTMKYNNGVYEGEWRDGKKNGQGIYTWSDGRKYEGAYLNDVRDGEGVFSGWRDSTNGYTGTYYGESKNDQFDGYGSFLFDNGDKFEGIYKQNLYWTGIYTRNDGSWYEVINGQPQK